MRVIELLLPTFLLLKMTGFYFSSTSRLIVSFPSVSMWISFSTSERNSRMRNSRHEAVHYVCDNSSVQILQTLICFVEFSSCFQRWKQTFLAILTDTQPGYTGYILATPSAHRTTAPPPRPVMFCIDSHSLIRYMFTYTNFLIFAYIIIH